MDLDLGGIMDKLHAVMPYLSYFISLINNLIEMFSSYFGVKINDDESSEGEPAAE